MKEHTNDTRSTLIKYVLEIDKHNVYVTKFTISGSIDYLVHVIGCNNHIIQSKISNTLYNEIM